MANNKGDLLRPAAHVLYMQGMNAKEIGALLKVSEGSLSDWVQKGGWREERASAIAKQKTMQSRLLNLIDYQLEGLEEIARTSRAEGKVTPLDKGEIDALAKMFAQIKGREMTWAQLVMTIRDFNNYLSQHEPDLAKALVPYSDQFLVQRREALQ